MEIAISSSHGMVIIDETGQVIQHYDDGELQNIAKFNPEEYRTAYPDEPLPGNIDILDIGYWTKNGQYEPPEEDWRQECAHFRHPNIKREGG